MLSNIAFLKQLLDGYCVQYGKYPDYLELGLCEAHAVKAHINNFRFATLSGSDVLYGVKVKYSSDWSKISMGAH